MAPTAVAERARPAQPAERRRGITDVKLIESFRKGLTVSRKLDVEKIAGVLQWPELGYQKAAAEKVARELCAVFNGTEDDLRRMTGKDRVKSLDILIKKALLVSPEIDEKQRMAVFMSIPKAEVSDELLDKMAEAKSASAEKKANPESPKEIERAFEEMKDGLAGTRFANLKLDFTPEASEQLDYGMKFKDSDSNGEYHRLARILPKLKMSPFVEFYGSPARGKEGTTVYGGAKYDLYHAGAERMDLRAYYIVKDGTIIIVEISKGKGQGHG
jgi:hypothetical protein